MFSGLFSITLLNYNKFNDLRKYNLDIMFCLTTFCFVSLSYMLEVLVYGFIGNESYVAYKSMVEIRLRRIRHERRVIHTLALKLGQPNWERQRHCLPFIGH